MTASSNSFLTNLGFQNPNSGLYTYTDYQDFYQTLASRYPQREDQSLDVYVSETIESIKKYASATTASLGYPYIRIGADIQEQGVQPTLAELWTYLIGDEKNEGLKKLISDLNANPTNPNLQKTTKDAVLSIFRHVAEGVDLSRIINRLRLAKEMIAKTEGFILQRSGETSFNESFDFFVTSFSALHDLGFKAKETIAEVENRKHLIKEKKSNFDKIKTPDITLY